MQFGYIVTLWRFFFALRLKVPVFANSRRRIFCGGNGASDVEIFRRVYGLVATWICGSRRYVAPMNENWLKRGATYFRLKCRQTPCHPNEENWLQRGASCLRLNCSRRHVTIMRKIGYNGAVVICAWNGSRRHVNPMRKIGHNGALVVLTNYRCEHPGETFNPDISVKHTTF